MNNNKLKIDISVWMLFIAAFLIVLFFLWYFFIYVNGQEKVLIQKSFRALYQLEENFKTRYDSYCMVIESTDMKNILSEELLDLNFFQKKKEMKKIFFGLEVLKKADSLNNSYIYFRKADTLYLNDIRYTAMIKDLRGETEKDSTEKVIFGMNKTDFFQPIQHSDVFEEIAFIKHKSDPDKNESFYSTYPGDVEVNKLDSLTKSYRGISMGTAADTRISGIDYKLFITELKLQNGEIYYVAGLINKDAYVSEARAINYYLALILVILFVIFLLSIPLFKLKITSENQEFKVSDLILSELSLIAGTFFILLVILSFLGYSRTKHKVDSSLEEISYSIETKFVDEINKIVRTLDLFKDNSLIVTGTPKSGSLVLKLSDSSSVRLNNNLKIGFRKPVPKGSNDLSHINLKNIEYIRTNDITYVSLDNKGTFIRLDTSTYSFFKLLFDLNSEGQMENIQSSRLRKTSSDNYSYRKYFSESGEWELNGNHIMIDFVISSTSGEQLGVVSERSGDSVCVITSRLTSVINPIMPPGYGFCIVDDKGDVKFHSDSERMLRENILAETGNSGELMSAIYGNNTTFFTARYMGTNHSFFIHPISTLPLYLITFYDNSYCNSVNIHVISNTILFIIILVLMFLLFNTGTGIGRYKKSDLKRKYDIVYFLKPAKHESRAYKKMIVTNFIAILLIIISCWLTSAATSIFVVYLYVLIQLGVVNYYIEILDNNKFSKPHSYGYLVASAIILLLIYYFAVKVDADVVYLTEFVFILIFIDFIFLKNDKLNPVIDFFLKKDESGTEKFYSYLFYWLGLMVITPIIIFFILFYNYETELDITHQVYSYARKQVVRSYDIDKFYHNYIKKSFSIFKNDRKMEGIYFVNGISPSDDSDTLSDPDNLDKMIIYLNPGLDKLGRERRSLVTEDFSNTVKIVRKSSDSVRAKYRMRQIHYSSINDPNIPQFISYTGKTYKFGFNKTETVIITLFVLAFILIIIYQLIKFTSNRVFGLSVNEQGDVKYLLESSEASGNNVIIHCPSLYNSYLDRCGNNEAYRVMNYKTTDAEEYSPLSEIPVKIIIKNLKPDFEHPEEDIKKLSAINKLAEKRKHQLFFVSDLSIEKLIENCKAKIKSEEYEYRLKPKKELLSKLESIDRKYEHIYSPLFRIKNERIKEKLGERLSGLDITPEAKETIKKELSVLGIRSKSIRNYAEQIIRFAVRNRKRDNLPDMIVLRVQELVKRYYEDLWADCTHDEKLLLDDISDNLLLNDKNKKVIRTLMAKGFLRKNISIDIVSRSFRNFVNTKAGEEEGKEYLEVRKTGNWTRYRAPLILILFAVAFFIVLQENLLSNIYSILTVVLGIMTIVTRMSGILSTTSLFKHSSGETG
jgi:hypothetical protein